MVVGKSCEYAGVGMVVSVVSACTDDGELGVDGFEEGFAGGGMAAVVAQF